VKRVVLCVALAAQVAHADDRAKAEAYFRAGEKAYQAQSFAAAAQNFEEAYKAAPLPEIAFSAAQAYRRQYRVDARPEYVARAVALYRIYLDQVKTGGRVADAADAMGEMQHELDKLIKAGVKVSAELAAEHTQLGVSITLAGTAATPAGMHEIDETEHAAMPAVTAAFDGKPVEPFTLVNIEPGTHTVHVEAPGYFPVDKQEVVVQGTTNMVEVTLEAKPAKVAFHVEAGARISVDGRPIGFTPLTADIAAGRHLVTITHRGREPVIRELVVRRGEEQPIYESLLMTKRRRAVPYVAITAGGVGVIAIATGIAALAYDHEASSLYDQIQLGNAPTAVGEDYENKRAWRDRLVTATWTTGALAVALGGVAAWMYYADHPSPDGIHVAPMAGTTGGGAMLFGSF
jgi:hypothetical protein